MHATWRRSDAASDFADSASACGSKERASRDHYFVGAKAPTHKEKTATVLARSWASLAPTGPFDFRPFGARKQDEVPTCQQRVASLRAE